MRKPAGIALHSVNARPADTGVQHPGARLRVGAARWATRPERGTGWLIDLMMFVALRLGRPLAHRLLHLIAGYYYVFSPRARRYGREYLRRVLGREPTSVERYRQVSTFATTILDRLYLTRERSDLLEISIEGEELMRAALERGRGAFLLGAHLGSFEMMSAVGRRQPGLRVALAMYTGYSSRIADRVGFGPAASATEIVPLGQLESMLRIRECLEEGKFVGMLADRSFGDSPAESVTFLGEPALFPTGPMRAAAALRRPVIFMAGLYRGGKRYEIHFEPLADFTAIEHLTRAERTALIDEAVAAFARRLEHHCRAAPDNFFNFYDFWR